MTQTSSRLKYREDGTVTVLFDLQAYSIFAVKKAVYKFAADCSAILNKSEENTIEVHLSFPDELDKTAQKSIVRALCNEVIDQDLREQIFQETEATRNLILAQAFSKTNLLSED